VLIEGRFKEADYKNGFNYKLTSDPWAKQNRLPHAVDFERTGEVRFARVLKTVAYLAVDENPDGSAKLQKWNIRQLWCKEARQQA
jgi:hypothetical protein